MRITAAPSMLNARSPSTQPSSLPSTPIFSALSIQSEVRAPTPK
jgi:hypothetical protein